MNRRKFISLMSSSAIAVNAATSAANSLPFGISKTDPPVTATRRRHPNVIFMICDDLGYGDLGCYGSNLPTPNLDAMSAGGLRFTHYNSAHPICSASRAALLSGRYGHRSNTIGAFGPHSPVGTSLEETLLSTLFHDRGYSTRAIGKWHLGDAPEYLPTARGFDSYFGVPYSDDMQPLPLFRDTKILEQDANRDLLTQLYTEDAVKYIQETKEPFFLYLGYSYPHDPAGASERFRGKTRFGDYGDSVAEIDWSVGEILKAVERSGIANDTLICFTSDHGPWYQGNPGLLRGRKASTFEGGVRVPFIAKWPGTMPPNQTIDSWCGHLDILPTMASLCGLTLPAKPLDGVDKSGFFIGSGVKQESKPQLYFSALSGPAAFDVHCIRKDQWKLRIAQGIGGEIYVNDRTSGSNGSALLARHELYDLSSDPTESYDVAVFHPEIASGLQKELDNAISSFSPQVVNAYSKLKSNVGDLSTPPGSSPRQGPPSPLEWVPEDRRRETL